MHKTKSQGLEFDRVFIVGVDEAMFTPEKNENIPDSLSEQKNRIDRDLLYVALTRAMNHLHVSGDVELIDVMN